MAICLVLFCTIFGVSEVVKNQRLKELDNLHAEEQAINRQNAIDQANKDIDTTQKNENNNTQPGVNSSVTTKDFSTFYNIYKSGEEAIKGIKYLYSYFSGSAKLSGTGSYGVIGNVRFTDLEAKYIGVREDSLVANNSYFYHYVSGSAFGFNIWNDIGIYTENAVCYHYYNYQRPKARITSKQAIYDLYNFNTRETIYTFNESDIVTSSSVIYDRFDKTYTASAELNVNTGCVKPSKYYQGIFCGTSPASFEKVKLTVVVDELGRFEEIRYQEIFTLNVKIPTNGATANVRIVTDYTEDFHNNVSFEIVERNYVKVLKGK